MRPYESGAVAESPGALVPRGLVLPGILQSLLNRIRRRPDTEFQQALIRVVIGLVFFAYFSSDLAKLDRDSLGIIQLVNLLFTAVATLIAVLTLFSQKISPSRRIVGMMMDYATCSFLMIYTGEAGSPLLVVYLWVTLGNGFRYGAAYLYAATAMAITGFLIVLAYSSYWGQHSFIGVAFLLSIIAIPLYVASLIKQVHFSMQRERKSSQAKSLFLANMSHEIRTPLTAIIGFSDALLDVNQSMAERIEGIQTINRAGKHLLGIINDILNLSKIEAGRLEVERLPVPLFGLLDEVAALARLQAEAKGVYFHVEPVFPLPQTLQSDPVRIKQILLNLINNAIKFTEQGGVTLRVRHDPAAAKLVLEVIDTGIGISPEQRARLFQAFTQADASTTRRFGGTGLGLALSKQLAEILGGGINVDSHPGQGSCFTLTLDTGQVDPLIHGPDQVQQQVPPLDEASDGFVLRGCLLLAEDNPDNQRLITLKARRLGAEPKVVGNGALALEAALVQPYDLILMDMQMPVMDGLTAVRALREKGYKGPIVALTANTSQEDRQRCMEAGFDGFLSKPIDRKDFDETLRRYLRAEAKETGEYQELPISTLLLQDPGMSELVGQFHHCVTGYHRDLQQALVAGNSEAVRQGARQMKSVGSEYVCPPLTELAGQLEFAATAGNGQAMRELIGKLGALARRIQITPPQEESALSPVDAVAPLVSALLQEGPEMVDLVEYFLGRLPGYEQELQAALASGDLVALKKQAHDLKSVGGGYGYPLVTELAVKLESAAQEGKLEEIAVHVEAFSRLAGRIQAGSAALHTAQVAVA